MVLEILIVELRLIEKFCLVIQRFSCAISEHVLTVINGINLRCYDQSLLGGDNATNSSEATICGGFRLEADCKIIQR